MIHTDTATAQTFILIPIPGIFACYMQGIGMVLVPNRYHTDTDTTQASYRYRYQTKIHSDTDTDTGIGTSMIPIPIPDAGGTLLLP